MPSQFFNSAILTALILSPMPPSPSLPTASSLTSDRPPTQLTQAPMTPPAKQQADQLLKQGNQQLEANNLTAAIASWQQALSLYQRLGDQLGQGKVLNNLGYAYSAQSAWEPAISAYQQSLAIADAIANPALKVNALAQLGRAYDAVGQPAAALKAYQQALPLTQQLKNQPGEAAVTGGIALAYETLKDYPNALDYYQRWLKLAQALGDSASAAIAQTSTDRLRRQLKSASPPTAPSTQALPDPDADRLLLAGLEHFTQQQFVAAVPLLEQALQRYRAQPNPAGELQALVSLGSAYLYQEQFTPAINHLELGLELARRLGDRPRTAQALKNLTVAYLSLGLYQKTLDYAQQLLALPGDPMFQFEALGGIGSAYTALGEFNRALPAFEQQVKLAQQSGDRFQEAAALGFLGDVYLGLNQGDRALTTFQSGLKLAQAIAQPELVGLFQGSIGKAYAVQGNYTAALPYLQQSLASERSHHSPLGAAFALNNLGNTLFLAGRLPEAEQTLRQAMQLWETQRSQLGANDSFQIAIFDAQALTYRTLQQVLVAQNNPNAALEIAERGRARALVELLKRRQPNAQRSQPTTPPPITLDQMRQITRQQKATLVQYAIMHDNRKLFVPSSPTGNPRNLETALYIWVISPAGEVTFRQVALTGLNTSLEALVTDTRRVLGVGDRATLVAKPGSDRATQTTRLQQLHKLLIAPIADRLPTTATEPIIFIPQGALFLVPFAALPDATGQPLIAQHTVLTSPSIQVLELIHNRRRPATPASTSALVVGNPTMPKIRTQVGGNVEPLANLPGAEREAQAIAQLLKTQAQTGQQAKKAAIVRQMPQAQVIHLATHGLLDDFIGLGFPGAIALAPDGTGQDNDGLLTSDEILEMNLQAELVVLSACDTGRGRITGDGVIGLSRSLITAGVPSIIVSLWKVPDAATAFLMTEFYRQRQQKSDKATALRQAMLTTKQKYPDPLDWAAFTLIGEAQ
jgi:CHAT domain-containing protein/tetratricopeptide (TPR) repeat protein